MYGKMCGRYGWSKKNQSRLVCRELVGNVNLYFDSVFSMDSFFCPQYLQIVCVS